MKLKQLIVIADDFGLHPAIDQGIMEGFKRGVVTSASVLIDGNTIDSVVRWYRLHKRADLGLHLSLDTIDSTAILEAEVFIRRFTAQYKLFRKLFCTRPTNISLHHSRVIRTIQKDPRLFAELLVSLRVFEKKIGIPLRFNIEAVTFSLAPHHASVTLKHLKQTLKNLRPGLNMLITHPARRLNDAILLVSAYPLQKREKEYGLLTNKIFTNIVHREHIHITNFVLLRG
jgi:predicted glycoside hydrolase/deacetylase ChbG (UPF0249 family)